MFLSKLDYLSTDAEKLGRKINFSRTEIKMATEIAGWILPFINSPFKKKAVRIKIEEGWTYFY